MKVRAIHFNNDEEPESLTVEMSDREAALVYAFLGHTPPSFLHEAGDGDAWIDVQDEITEALAGGFFNRMFDAGWQEIGPRRIGEAVRKATRGQTIQEHIATADAARQGDGQ